MPVMPASTRSRNSLADRPDCVKIVAMLPRAMRLAWAIASSRLAARATDESKLKTLTPKEIADGWILPFDGETTFGWTALNDSKWTIANGMLAGKNGVTLFLAGGSSQVLQQDSWRTAAIVDLIEQSNVHVQLAERRNRIPGHAGGHELQWS